MSEPASKWLVETDWLAAHLDTPGLVILDGSMHLPTAKRNARAEYLAEHIPGALFFDIDDIADENSPLPHMLPSSTKFASRMKKMGIGDGMHVDRLRQRGPLLGRARVVDVPRHGPRAGAGPERRPQEMEGRAAAARGWRGPPPHRAPLHGHAQRRARARRRRRQGPDRQQGGADRRRPRRRPLRGQRARAARGPALRTHPGLAQRAIRLAAQSPTARSRLRPSCAPSSPRPASSPASRSSPPAARASPPAWWRWRSPSSAAPTPPSTTAPGPNGAPTRRCRSRPARPDPFVWDWSLSRGGRGRYKRRRLWSSCRVSGHSSAW